MKNVSFYIAIAMSILFLFQSCISYKPEEFIQSNIPSKVDRIALIYKTDINNIGLMSEFFTVFKKELLAKSIDTKKFVPKIVFPENSKIVEWTSPWDFGSNIKDTYSTDEKSKESKFYERKISEYNPDLRLKIVLKKSGSSVRSGTWINGKYNPGYSIKGSTFKVMITNKRGHPVYSSTFHTDDYKSKNALAKSLSKKMIADLLAKNII